MPFLVSIHHSFLKKKNPKKYEKQLSLKGNNSLWGHLSILVMWLICRSYFVEHFCHLHFLSVIMVKIVTNKMLRITQLDTIAEVELWTEIWAQYSSLIQLWIWIVIKYLTHYRFMTQNKCGQRTSIWNVTFYLINGLISKIHFHG